MNKNWSRTTPLFILYVKSLFFELFTRQIKLQIKQDLMY